MDAHAHCPGCGKPYESPDHDPRCSSCAESGTLEDPPPPGATNCPQCARLLAELCRVNFELGKAHGELAGLRAGWSVSNHEAWERGHRAHPYTAENPFPKPKP